MAKQLYNPPTNQDAHKVATLVAVNLPLTNILLRTGLSKAGLRHVTERDDWPALLDSKKAAIARLMGGDA